MSSYLSDCRFITPASDYKFACRKLNYTPRDVASQEEEKHRASEIMNSNCSMVRKLSAAETYVSCHFDRSLTAAMQGGYWHEHPRSAKQFGRMVDYDAGSVAFPNDVVAKMRELNGAYSPGHIKPGSAYWSPKSIVA